MAATRKEKFLEAIATGNTEGLPSPITREEMFLKQIAEKGVGSSGAIDANSAYEIAVENGYTGTLAEWISSVSGTNGKDGKSAYAIAVEQGYEGTEAEFGEALTELTEPMTNIDFAQVFGIVGG